MSDMRP